MKRLFYSLFLAPFLACAVYAGYPASDGYVSDYAGALDARSKQALSAALSDLDKKANAQVAVAVVKNLNGKDIGTYATELFKHWGVGKKPADRGVLLLVALEDRKSRIEVGYGLEGILPDGLTGEIQDAYMLPYFKRGEYSQGVINGALALTQVIAKDAGVTISAGAAAGAKAIPKKTSLTRKLFNIIFFLILIVIFIKHPSLFFLLLLSSGGRGGFGGGFGGGSGGFGGGLSGGGGASRGW
ncbi:MAG: TPM domain-containing protein [Elusimicrobia bacterium]|nr:TPM domain-containing protein [Elusimicrobiota bacterium]